MTKLRMKCRQCGCWNRVKAHKIFVQQPSPEPKVKVLIPMYKPLKTEKCKNCGRVIAEPKELIRIMKSELRKFSLLLVTVTYPECCFGDSLL
jgi:ssDNA-binding Zn-finger/Zn-ribbon topoisomerase 1